MKDFNPENIPGSQGSSTSQLSISSSVPNEYGGIYEKPKALRPSFIKSRLNKDNFWNLMFFFGTSLSVLIAQFIVDIVPGGIIILFLTLISTPYFITRVNKVEFKDSKFFSSSDGRHLFSHLPKELGLVLWLSIPFTIIGIFFIHNKYPILDENLAVYNAIFWFIPIMYFIIKNYPISIIFNKIAWTRPIDDRHTNSSYKNSSSLHNSDPKLSLNNLIYSPLNSWYSGNIYHRKR